MRLTGKEAEPSEISQTAHDHTGMIEMCACVCLDVEHTAKSSLCAKCIVVCSEERDEKIDRCVHDRDFVIVQCLRACSKGNR